MPSARRPVRDLREPPESPGEVDAPRTDPLPHPVARVAATLNPLHSQGPQRGQRAEAVSLQETSVGAAPGLEAVRRRAEINPVGLSVSQELTAMERAAHVVAFGVRIRTRMSCHAPYLPGTRGPICNIHNLYVCISLSLYI
jgi:hypothetical protein